MNPRPDPESDATFDLDELLENPGDSPAAAAKFDASDAAEYFEITPPTEEPERAPGDIPATGEGKSWRY